MSVGRRVHGALILLAATLTWSAGSASTAAATAPAHVVVGGVEVPTNLSQITDVGAALGSDAAGNVYFAHNTSGGGERIYEANAAGALTVVAGNGTVPTVTGDGSLAVNVGIAEVTTLTLDGAGNLFFFDGTRIRKISATDHKISTVAGNGTAATTSGAGDGSAATSVSLAPDISDLTVDSAGNVFFIEPAYGINFEGSGTGLVRKITASTGLLSSILGSTTESGDCTNLIGSAASVRFANIEDLTTDGTNLFVAVYCYGFGSGAAYGDRILQLTPGGSSTVIAGGGSTTADTGVNPTSTYISVASIRATAAHDVYFAANGVLYKVNGSTLTRVVGSVVGDCLFADGTLSADVCMSDFVLLPGGAFGLVAGYSVPGYGVLTAGVLDVKTQATVPPDGADARQSTLPGVGSLAVAPDGTVYFAGGTTTNVRSITTASVLGTKAGNGTFDDPIFNGQATASPTPGIESLDADTAGNLYMVSDAFPSVMEVTTSGVLKRVAGTGTYDNGPDGGQAAQTPVTPEAVAAAANGDVYFATRGYGPCGPFYCTSSAVRKVSASTGVLSTVLPGSPDLYIDDLALSPSGSAVLAQAATDTELLQLNTATGRLNDIGTIPGAGDTTRAHVRVDAAGTIFVSDGTALWKMTKDGTVTKIDTLYVPLAADEGFVPPLQDGLDIDSAGNVYTVAGDRIVKYPGIAAASSVVAAIADDDIADAITHTAVDIDVKANDVISSGTLASPTISQAPASGTATVLGSGHISYTSATGFSGLATFKYSVCGTAAQAAVCDTATVSVIVVATLPTVTATADTGSVNSAAKVDVDVRGNDSISTGTLARPTVTIAPTHGTAAILPSGAIRYTANAHYVGSDTLTYSVCSYEFPSRCTTATVGLTVNAPPATISGTVYTGPSTPLTSGGVTAYPAGSPYAYTSVTLKSDGTYTFPSLPAGSYDLVAYPSGGSPYAPQAFSGAYTLSSATAIPVVNGDELTGKDFTLKTGGTITGTVTDATGTALNHACVSLSGNPLPTQYFSSTNYACTDASGVYTFAGLAPGNYVLYFSKSDVTPAYTGEYYNDQPTSTSANSVTVALGATKDHIDAQLLRQGSISGSVIDGGTSKAVTGGRVDAFSTSSTSTFPTSSAYVGYDGTYSFASLAPGSYKLVIYPTTGSGYAPQAYSGAYTMGSATAVAVTAGATASGKIFVLAQGGKITGKVTDSVSGAGLANVCVTVGNSPLPQNIYGSPITCTDATGNYTIRELATGSYSLYFAKSDVSPGYVAQYYNNKTALNADPVSTTVGAQTSNINVSLVRSSRISGQLTDAVSGAALGSDIYESVTAVNTTTSATFTANNTYSSPGTYSMDLPPGTYKLYASNPAGVYATQYYSNKLTLATADALTTTGGGTTTANFALSHNASIHGIVKSASGTPLAGITVNAFAASSSTSPVTSATTANDGTYTLSAPTGSYVLQASDPGGNYITSWYANASTFDTATIVTLNTTDIVANISMSPGGSFTGTVTSGGVPMPNVYVVIYANNSFLEYVYTDSQGKYSSLAVPAGSYKAAALGTNFYSGNTTYGNATLINVTTSHVTPNIDFPLPGGGVSGTVTDSSTGQAISSALITLYAPDGTYAQRYTNYDGTYAFPGLAAGNYKVLVTATGHQSEYYDNKATLVDATPIAVAGTVVAGINVALSPGIDRALVGTVTDSTTGNPIAACVSAVDTTSLQRTRVCTGSDGKYAITVPPGKYSLDLTSDGYVEKLVAGPFTVATGSSITNDVAMTFGGAVSGSVTDQSGTPLRGVCIGLYDTTNIQIGPSSCTQNDGSFTIVGIPTGSYKLYTTTAGRYVKEYYDNQTSFATANAIAVTNGQTSSGILIGLILGGSVKGTVTSGGQPVANACVDALNAAGDTVLATACTDVTGSYQIDGIPAGPAKIRFTASGFLTQYYNNATTVGAATSVAVTSGGMTAAVNAVLVSSSNVPTNVVAVAGNAQATVTWSAPPSTAGITDYRVEYSSNNGGTWTPFAHAASTTTSATVTSLTNGTSYIFRVTPMSGSTAGTTSASSAAVTPATTPGAPTAVTGVAGDASVAVSWIAPASTGGSPISSYQVTSSPSGKTCTATGVLTCSVTGLANGTTYTFTVVASNGKGTGAASTASAPVTPRTVPGAPTAVTGTAADAKVNLSWTAPTVTGGSSITDYFIEYSANGSSWSPFAHTASAAVSATVNNLVNGQPYVFRVSAINVAGTGAVSAVSSAITPNGTPPPVAPGAPTAVTGVAGNGSVAVSWTAPSSTGGSPITGYTVTSSPESKTCTPTPATSTSCTVTGLNAGDPYTFTVTAKNVAGTGAASAPSIVVTPYGKAAAPGVNATAGDSQATVAWTAPVANGSAISGYTVTRSPLDGTGCTSLTASSTSCTFTGLTNGVQYTFTVKATNAAGAGNGGTATATPMGLPGAPTGVGAVPGDAQATVSWVAPTNAGGASSLTYKVTSTPVGGSCTIVDALSCLVGGLTNGQPYTFSVTASNGVGAGAAGTSAAVTPVATTTGGGATAPGAPRTVTGAAGASQATVSWLAPTSNGGATITKYVVTAAPGGATCQTTGALSCIVTALTNGQAYTFSVVATNSAGPGPSASSGGVTPRTTPGAARTVTGVAGDGQVTLSWLAPTSNGGAAITKYVATSTPDGAICQTTGALTCVVTGLDNGTAYTFAVVATNAAGAGAAGTSAAVTPVAVPAAPTNVVGVAGDALVNLSWTAPDNGGSPITDYTVESSADNGTTFTTFAHTVSTSTTATVTGLTNAQPYVFRVSAVNAVGTGPASAVSAPVTPVAQVASLPAEVPFAPLPAPGRLLDTRADGSTQDGSAQGGGQNPAGTTLELVVAGRDGVPIDASSAILNVTVVNAQAPGFVTVWPCGVDRPNASNLNFVNGETIPNAVISKIGTGGRVCLYSSATVGLVVDVAGFFPSDTAFTPLAAPARLLDTRAGSHTQDNQYAGQGANAGGTTLELPIAGRAGVPATAASVVLNVTAVAPTAAGFITVFPCGGTRPNASNLNFTAGQVIPNAVVTKVGAGGKVCLFSNVTTDILVDVAGYFASNEAFLPLDSPARLLDTRPGATTVDGLFLGMGPLAGNTEIQLQVGGRANVDGNASSAVLNVTAVDPSAAGYVTVYPCGVTRPTASNLNFAAGQTIPNAVISKLGAAGKICLFSNVTTGLIVDIAGTLS